MPSFSFRLFILSVSIYAAASGNAFAETNSFTVEPYIGQLAGYTAYDITVPGVESELQWPVDSQLWGVAGTVHVDKRFIIEGTLRKNMGKNTGKMKDSDWINGSLAIYSESDSEMDMTDIDIAGRYNFPYSRSTNIGMIFGYRSQEFSFNAKNLDQKDKTGGHPEFNVKIAGLVGTYDVKYSIPYIGVGVNSRISEKTQFDLSARLGFVSVSDEDDHVLRYKKSTGSSTGNSIGISGAIVYDINPKVYIKLDGDYLLIHATGKQTQRWYATTSEATAGTTISDIDLKINSFQALTTIGLGIRF